MVHSLLTKLSEPEFKLQQLLTRIKHSLLDAVYTLSPGITSYADGIPFASTVKVEKAMLDLE
jgi:hypothetical protein